MVARRRAGDESYEDYKLNLKEEKKHQKNSLAGNYISMAGTALSEPIPVVIFKTKNEV